MAFRMNKPVIQGTKKHSALLKTAKAEQVRTHGGDPSLIEASALYGASNSPDVIDYKIKQSKIKWKKGKKGKDKESKDDPTTDAKPDTFQLDYERRKLDRKIGPNKRKKIVAEEDKNRAINTLIANAGADDTEGQDENRIFDSEGNEITTVNPDSVIGYPHDYSNIDKMPTPKKETWRDRRRKRQEEKDLAKLNKFQANYPTEKIESEKIKSEQLEIDQLFEKEQDDPDNFPKGTLAENDPRSNIEATPRYNAEGKVVGYNYPPGYFTEFNDVHPAQVPEVKEKKVEKKKVVEKKVEKISQKRNMGKQSDVVGTIDGTKVTNSDIGELRRIARSSQNFREKIEAKKKLDRLQKN